jgi:hypothetical protein
MKSFAIMLTFIEACILLRPVFYRGKRHEKNSANNGVDAQRLYFFDLKRVLGHAK